MADKITTEFLSLDNVLGGEIYFGLGYAIGSNNAKKITAHSLENLSGYQQ